MKLAWGCNRPKNGPGIENSPFDLCEGMTHEGFPGATECPYRYTWQSCATIHQRSSEEGCSLVRFRSVMQLLSSFKLRQVKDAASRGSLVT